MAASTSSSPLVGDVFNLAIFDARHDWPDPLNRPKIVTLKDLTDLHDLAQDNRIRNHRHVIFNLIFNWDHSVVVSEADVNVSE